MHSALLDAFRKAIDRPDLPAARADGAAVVWPYGDMDYAVEGGCVWLGDVRLAMAGDWAFNGRVEGAWLSGTAAAQKVLAVRE